LLCCALVQYKFIVDGEWKYAPEQPAMYDERGNVNNVVEVCEYTPENLDNLHSFAPPSSPPRSYDNGGPSPDDFAKEPPTAPPQLHLTLLNVPPMCDAPNILPRPQHVILNHMYCEKSRHAKGAVVLGATHRYRSKYITVVLYSGCGSSGGGARPAVAAAAAGSRGGALGSGSSGVADMRS
jgi:5'-AMP-activated protein kinase regulatory beta subunit